MRRSLLGPGLGAALLVAAPAAAHAAPAAGLAAPTHTLAWDFNGDGYPDLAIGATTAAVGGVPEAGTVDLVMGSAAGPDLTRSRTISRATPGIPGSPGERDAFGRELASDDLNGDGYADLAIGMPGQGYENLPGRIFVIYGSAQGLSTTTHPVTTITAGQDGVPAESIGDTGFGRHLGGSLAVGDFDGDGIDDLAAGQPVKNLVNVFPGSRSGLVPAEHRPVSGVGSASGQLLTVFGDDLAAADLNGDGIDDLVASAVQQTRLKAYPEVQLFRGSPAGLRTAPRIVRGVAPYAEGQKTFVSVAAGDIDADGRDDVVFQDGGPTRVEPNGDVVWDGGSITVALSGDAFQPHWYDQDSPGIPGLEEAGDLFGYSLAVAKVDGDRYADVLVGSRQEAIGTVREAGAVTVLHGSASGLSDPRGQFFDQDTPGVPGRAETRDHFGGGGLAARDLNGDGYADLAVGAPGENSSDGSVTLLFGGASGVTTAGAHSFGARSLGAPYTDAHFGDAVG